MNKKAATAIATDTIKHTAASGLLSIFELTNPRSKSKKIVVFSEIEISDKDNDAIIEQIANEIKNQFFNAPTETSEYAFENALTKANIKIKDKLLAKPKNWLSKIHIVVLATSGEEVHLASVGNIHAFLTHNQKIVDVLKSPSQTQTPNPVKLFTNIVSGKLAIGNSMVLINESVLDYLSIERIRKCAQENTPNEAIIKLNELLSRAPESKQFGLGIITRSYKKVPQQEQTIRQIAEVNNKIKKYSDKKSHKPTQENQEENAVEKYLAPSKINRFESSKVALSSYTPKIKQLSLALLTFVLSVISKLLEAIERAFKRIIPLIISMFRALFSIGKHQSARTYHLSKIKLSASAFISNLIHTKPRKKQVIGLAVFLLVAIFVISISLRARENTTQEIKVNFQSQLTQIEQKVSQAEASLIYNNESGAKSILIEALALLSAFREKFPQEQDNYTRVRNTIANMEDRIEKKQPIENLSTLATIIPAPISTNATGLIGLGTSVYFYDGIQEKISSIDTDQGLLLSLPLESQGITSFNTALALTDETIVGLAKDTALIVDADTEIISKQKFDFDPEKANAFASYSSNLYTFDISENQIIRFRRAGKGFTAAQNWLTQEYELATIQDISVDGFVYLLDSQGNIHVFLRGKFNNRLPWPAADEPGSFLKLHTNENVDVFYILDPDKERIIRMTKSGELVVQLTDPFLAKATDILASNDDSNLFVLAADKIYQIPIQQ
ncbi:hypothetical protein CL632_02515 [bacterium]|nr:hypothetical protein [bacterium]MDP6756215.1 hypothetical protein [Patescibacteria group bacterium]|tara:strand:- start:15853 stop:18039 length:2187 start_codon:yes stop_codon:yes gene_type:complete